MFDEARTDLTDALANNNSALDWDEAKGAIDGSDLMAEQALTEVAQIEESDGDRYVVGLADSDKRFPIEDGAADADSPDTDDDESGAEGDESDEEAEEDPEASVEKEVVSRGSLDVQSDEKEFHRVNGLRVDVDPERALAGEPTGQDIHGAPILTNSHPDIPDTSVPYHPAELGERDTEDLMYRAIARQKPILLEGEAGTGKNQGLRSVAASLNLPTYRQEFGSDTTVMDVVGERDLTSDGGTYYILGAAARAAIFGGIYIADEISMATGSVTSYLHPLFEETGQRELQLRGTGRTLRDLPEDEEWDPDKHLGRYIHPHFYPTATTNPLGYSDVKDMNAALRSRMLVIEHPYLAESEDDTEGIEAEAELLHEETGVEPEAVKDLVRAVAVLREAKSESRELNTPIGHRELRDTVEMAGPDEEFMSFAAAAKIKVVGQAQLPDEKQYIKDTLREELDAGFGGGV
jgi:nitric oxide reductase NorQ protein